MPMQISRRCNEKSGRISWISRRFDEKSGWRGRALVTTLVTERENEEDRAGGVKWGRKRSPANQFDIGWLKSITSLPILIKGVLTAEDARMAVDAGVAGVIVSNHGARQLDYVPASITVLEEVVEAVAGRVPVLVDGGIRRGTDVFKALALGAQAVMVGRPVIYGLAAKGEYGARRVIEMLRDELELTMALNGCHCVKDITRSYVRTERDQLRYLL